MASITIRNLDDETKERLRVRAAEAMFEADFAGRIVSFSSLAAHAYAEIAVARRQSGRPISQFDAQIAAIAKSVSADVATRNVPNFKGCGIKVIDAWQA